MEQNDETVYRKEQKDGTVEWNRMMKQYIGKNRRMKQ